MSGISVKERDKIGGKESKQIIENPNNDPWPVEVDVYLQDVTVDPPRFSLDTYLPLDRHDPQQVITFNNCGRKAGFEIKFNLIDETGGGYCFPPQKDRDKALWSRQGPGCPPDDYGKQWDEFTVVRVVEPDRLTLIVRNKNQTVTQFGYTLRVTNDDTNYLSLDPGGNNQNSSLTNK